MEILKLITNKKSQNSLIFGIFFMIIVIATLFYLTSFQENILLINYNFNQEKLLHSNLAPLERAFISCFEFPINIYNTSNSCSIVEDINFELVVQENYKCDEYVVISGGDSLNNTDSISTQTFVSVLNRDGIVCPGILRLYSSNNIR